MDRPVDPEIEAKIEALTRLKRRALDSLWLDLFSRPCSPSLRRETLLRVFAYRLQEIAFGGLKPLAVKKLRSLAISEGGRAKTGALPTQRPKAGTRLVRVWRGKLHEVEVLVDGYEYEGKKYGSLSKIARTIAGTRWSGPLFFGIKSRKEKTGVR